MGSEFPGSPTVLFWENVYLQKYSGDINDGYELPLVDQEILYNGLDSLVIKAAGETTGVPKSDFFNFLETPDYRTPFPDIVSQMKSNELVLLWYITYYLLTFSGTPVRVEGQQNRNGHQGGQLQLQPVLRARSWPL